MFDLSNDFTDHFIFGREREKPFSAWVALKVQGVPLWHYVPVNKVNENYK